MDTSIKPALMVRLAAALELTDSLAHELTDDALALRIGKAPSNRVGEQFWCIVGARESYARAIIASEWSGFSCTLAAADTRIGDAVRTALAASQATVIDAVHSRASTDVLVEMVFRLLEHEVMHHGQLIRYFYGNALPFPKAFAERYALAQPKGGLRTT